MAKKLNLKKGLLIVDVQNDFCPRGSLAVPEGDKIITVLNKYIRLFSKEKLPIFASRDWHPKITRHFKDFGGLWSKHCIQKTKGADFHPVLKLTKETIIISKGMDPEKDSYSAFQAQDQTGMEFANLLHIFGIKEIFVAGLATDYCVKYSVLDALRRGFKVKLLADAIRGVNINPDDSKRAVEEMQRFGAKTINFVKLTKSLK